MLQKLNSIGETSTDSGKIIIYDKYGNVKKSITPSTGNVTGSGTINYLPKWTGSTALGNSQIFDNGTSVGVNTASPSASYNLDVNGTMRVQGTELRLDNGTTGVINLYSTTPSIQFFSADPTGYRFYRSGTNMILNTAGAIQLQLSGNIAYQFEGANGHIWRTGLSGQVALARLDTGGSLSIGNGSTAANASSILDLTSTTKGFLPPRMTSAQRSAISSPENGLVLYQNDGTTGLYQYNSGVWQRLTTGNKALNFLLQHTSTTYADGTNYYFGGVPMAAATSQNQQRGIFNVTGTITSISFFIRCTGTPTTESISFSLWIASGIAAFGSAAYTNTFSWSGSSSRLTVVFSGLSIAVNSGDTYECYFAIPTMATNPGNANLYGNITVEY